MRIFRSSAYSISMVLLCTTLLLPKLAHSEQDEIDYYQDPTQATCSLGEQCPDTSCMDTCLSEEDDEDDCESTCIIQAATKPLSQHNNQLPLSSCMISTLPSRTTIARLPSNSAFKSRPTNCDAYFDIKPSFTQSDRSLLA